MESYGIGYTIFKYTDTGKIPVMTQKVYPGNMGTEFKKLEAKIAKLNKAHKLNSLCFAAGLWGMTFRFALEVIH